jgi:hypothetical protein
VNVTMMLADAAQVSDNKLYILGGGWSIAHGANPMALAIKIGVPWDQANRSHSWSIELLSEDGQPVTIADPNGERPLRIEGKFEVGRPPGLKPGTPLDVPLAMSIGPLPLPPGRYIWRLVIDDRSDEAWQIAFDRLA